MKKIIILIICFLSFTDISKGFFGSPTSIDLYKNIDSGIETLNSNIVTIELTDILQKINKYAELKNIKQCLDENKNITTNDFKELVIADNISILSKYIKKECKNNGSIDIELLKDYLILFKEFNDKTLATSDKKTQYIYKISNIGLYSDGIVANSGFDLINDIKEIDKIIFKDIVEYKGKENVDLGATINDSLKNIKNSMNDFLYSNRIQSSNIKNTDNKIIISPPKPKKYFLDIDDTANSYVCLDKSLESGLSSESLNFLVNNIKNNTENLDENGINNEVINNPDSNTNNNLNNNGDLNGKYSKVTDNSIWPCNTFFCIKVDFITYNHNLFGGGENISIEYLLNRSNEHLGKFAGTSLLPAKMSNNNFELGLSDLNLPDLFHIGFQISSRPIPILQIEKQGKKDESEFASKNMLEKYYTANGLDYKRRNDLSLFGKEEQDKQNILNSQNLLIKKTTDRQKEYINIYDAKQKESALLEKTIEKKVLYSVSKTFETQYSEIEIFTKAINEYVKNMHSIISAMKEIPIDKG